MSRVGHDRRVLAVRVPPHRAAGPRVEAVRAAVERREVDNASRWLVTAGPRAASVWDLRNGRKLFGLNARDRLITVAFSPRHWGIASGGLAGGVKVYDCRLCGNLSDLKTLARERLAPLRR